MGVLPMVMDILTISNFIVFVMYKMLFVINIEVSNRIDDTLPRWRTFPNVCLLQKYQPHDSASAHACAYLVQARMLEPLFCF